MSRIRRIGVIQTSLVLAVIYTIISLVIFVPLGIINMVTGAALRDSGGMFAAASGVMMFVMPLIYGVVTFITVAIFCLVYNFIAGKMGGIELELTSSK